MPLPSAAKLELGHGAIDAQHRKILDLQDEAIAAFRAGDRLSGIVALGALEEAMGEHFDFEERLMRDACYPELAIHREAHRLFATDLAQLASAISAGTSSPAAALWLESRIGSWLKLHVRTNDAALVRHLAAVPAPPSPPEPTGVAESAQPG